ncbi:MAG TPA: hypothetical protein VJ792_02120 [Candidatus Nitrosotalea sp.]|nr:hypothetical protein [Candidatus Nitrosotalea sp.]
MSIEGRPDALHHEKTRSITFRLPEDLVEEIQTEAQLTDVSPNVLVHKILERYTRWDSRAAKAGYVPVTKGLIHELFERIPDKDIVEIAERVERKEFQDITYLLRNEFNIESVFDIIEMRAKVSGQPFRYAVKGNLHSVVLQHDLGPKWSVYLVARYKAAFEDLGLTNFKFHTTPNTIQFDIFLEKPSK